MAHRLRLVGCIALAAIVLAGCRYGSTYTINADDTVTGRIYTALYQEPGGESVQPSVESDADTIAASFTTSSITPHNEGDWVGYFVYFNNEPLATFANPPETTWDVQILKVGSQYQVFGYTATEENMTRSSANENSGSLELDVYFPGTLVEATGADETNVGLGWAHFNLLTQPVNQTPYAKGNSPAAAPDPDPVVTIVIAPDPDPDPIVTPSPSASATPSPSPSAAPLVNGGGGDSIPAWVWVVGGVLVAALAGMIGFAVANRKSPAEVAPAAKPKAKPKVEEEPAEDDVDEAEEGEEDESPTPPKKK